MKITFFETQDWQRPIIEQNFVNEELVMVPETLTEDTAHYAQGSQMISVFVDSRITDSVIHQLQPDLDLIATRSTGFDHINHQTANEFNIKIANVPTYGDNTVAEHTIALILTISRKIYQTIDRTERGKFSLDGLRGFDLRGKTIGIYGLGSIGKHVARMARGFDMRILAYKRTPDQFLADILEIEYVAGLDDILSQSDIITLHCPLNEHTQHLINQHNIHKIKPGAVLINTARGGLVETEALLLALEQGILSSAGLDVLEEEQPLKEEIHLLSKSLHETSDVKNLLMDHVLIARDDVIFTAHNAFNSHEAVRRILDTTITNIHAHMQGNPQNIV